MFMDFYIDQNGNIANEFYRINEAGELLKIESGIKPIEDRNQIEKIFRTYYLKY